MTDSGIVLADTNVILDVTEEDENWAEWSDHQINHYVGRILINPIIFAELCYEAGSAEDVNSVISLLGLGFEEIPRKALYLASQAYRKYRERGGLKTAPLPDFFIGAHAEALGIPIITRDVKRYRTYFPTVKLISP